MLPLLLSATVDSCTTDIWLVVRVPVLSLQMTVVHPSVSTDGSFLNVHTRVHSRGWGGEGLHRCWTQAHGEISKQRPALQMTVVQPNVSTDCSFL
jgi:hypothetical protein